MMSLSHRLHARLTAFKRAESGSMNIELVLVVPLLLVITLGLIGFFDAFKAKSTAARTASVVSDMVSRETSPITPDYLDSMSGVMQSMIESDEAPEFRLSSIMWDDASSSFQVGWSQVRGNRAAHTDQSLATIIASLPQVRDGQAAVLLETWVDYDPLTNFGFDQSTTFVNLRVAPQRYIPQLCYISSLDADATTAVC